MLLATEDPSGRAWRHALEATRLALVAHAEAQERALQCAIARVANARIARFAARARASHRTQERLLDCLSDASRPLALRTNDALELRSSLISHDEQERLIMLPGLRHVLPAAELEQLAGRYATERLRALGAIWRISTRTRPDSAQM